MESKFNELKRNFYGLADAIKYDHPKLTIDPLKHADGLAISGFMQDCIFMDQLEDLIKYANNAEMLYYVSNMKGELKFIIHY